jgi:DNA-binding NarL/FixJ family response regulator
VSNGILIADDSAHARRIVRNYLTNRSFLVCGEATDGNDAIEKARELQPSLIILDLMMPEQNGVELASALKGMLPDVRIILFTMYNEILSYKSILSAIGFDAAVSKLDGLNTLADCVQGLLSG